MAFEPISDTIKNMIFELHDQGKSMYAIAEELMIDRNTVYKYLLRSGRVKPDPENINNARKRFSDEDIEAMVSMYEEGVTIREIQDIFDVSAPTIYRHAKKAGVSGRTTSKKSKEKALKMYKSDKYSVQEILDTTGVPRASLYAEINKRKKDGTWEEI